MIVLTCIRILLEQDKKSQEPLIQKKLTSWISPKYQKWSETNDHSYPPSLPPSLSSFLFFSSSFFFFTFSPSLPSFSLIYLIIYLSMYAYMSIHFSSFYISNLYCHEIFNFLSNHPSQLLKDDLNCYFIRNIKDIRLKFRLTSTFYHSTYILHPAYSI